MQKVEGWGTADSEEALGYLRRFGSVTVLNGHIHQTMQKVEGNVRFHTAMSTAFPQPAPGAAPSPGPMKVPAEKLRSVLGIREVELVQSSRHLANRRFDIGVTMKPTRLLIAGLMAEVLVLGFTTAADSAIRTL